MTKAKDGGSAFPYEYLEASQVRVHPGMSLRDWFAGQMLQGFGAAFASMVADDGASVEDMGSAADGMALVAYTFADAMLAERAKGGA